VVQLDPGVAERIAAGEVVERPASVVKELVENALDAGATQVFVEIKDGGQTFLRVTDNGCGMSQEDAVLALLRFATSKIREWEDLERLDTLGFRGEALPSIVAVSRTEIVTREVEAPHGTRIVVHGAEAPRIEAAGCPEGTTITVTDLFFNTPARRKFLKSATAEAARIIDILGRLALARTDVHFRLTVRNREDQQSREVFNFPVQYALADRVAKLWNTDAGFVTVQAESEGARVVGVVAPPPIFAASRVRQAFYVNGRMINPATLSVALAQGFDPLLPDRKFPIGVLFVDVPPDLVDVNIHPTKAEVRFLHPREVFRVVRDAVADGLRGHGAGPLDAAEAVARHAFAEPRQVSGEHRPRLYPSAGHAPSASERPTVTAARVEAAMDAMQPLLPEMSSVPTPIARVTRPSKARWQVLAQLDRTYIVCLRGDELWLVDQHTAHERIHYEALSYITDGGTPPSQPLMFPLLLDLAPDEAQALQDSLETFAALGYEIEPFGGSTFVVRALPVGIERLSRPETIRQIVAEVLHDGAPREAHRLRDLLRATTACRASVMAGDVLTREEMEILLERLETVEHAAYCPHGRPVSVRLGADELARLFGRK